MTTDTTTTGAAAKSGLAAYTPAVIMVIAAAVVGAVVGLVAQDAKTGLYAAFGTAVLAGIVLGRLFGSAALAGLSLKQRRRSGPGSRRRSGNWPGRWSSTRTLCGTCRACPGVLGCDSPLSR